MAEIELSSAFAATRPLFAGLFAAVKPAAGGLQGDL
jgi:hypothetical protein